MSQGKSWEFILFCKKEISEMVLSASDKEIFDTNCVAVQENSFWCGIKNMQIVPVNVSAQMADDLVFKLQHSGTPNNLK